MAAGGSGDNVLDRLLSNREGLWNEYDKLSRTEIDHAEAEHQKFRQKLEKSSAYRKMIRKQQIANLEANGDDLRSMLQTLLEQSSKAQKKHDQRGRTQQLGHRVSNFLSKLQKCMESYSGIVDVVKGAGGKYGQIACGTVSILLMIVVNKKAADDAIGTMLQQLHNQFSRFTVLEKIHSTAKMKSYIATVYRLGIEFLIEATYWFLRSSLGRLWSAIIKPPAILDIKVTEITSAMAEINTEKSLLDSERMHNMELEIDWIKRTVTSIDTSTSQTRTHVSELQSLRGKDDLEKLRRKFVPDHEVILQRLRGYHRAITAAFGDNSQDACHKLDELQNSKSFRDWNERAKSSLLLLRGQTFSRTHLCWLSRLALSYCETLKRKKEIFAFHCCQTKDSADFGDDLGSLLGHLILQLLELNPQILTDPNKLKWIESKVNHGDWGKSPQIALDVLVDLIRHFGKVTLILDRIDLMRGGWEANAVILASLLKEKDIGDSIAKLLFIGSCMKKGWEDLEEELKECVGRRNFFRLWSDEAI